MISTSTIFQCYVVKIVLVEFLCSTISTSGNWLCSTDEFCIVRFFPNPKNSTKRGPPVLKCQALRLSSHFIIQKTIGILVHEIGQWNKNSLKNQFLQLFPNVSQSKVKKFNFCYKITLKIYGTHLQV